jgi:hypothetical protein
VELHHRHKQRILTTVATLIAFVIGVDAFIILQPIVEMSIALLFSFAAAIGVVTAYQCYNYRHSHEHLTLVNTLTQIFMGTVLFAGAILILLLQAFFGMEVTDSYLVLSLLVIFLTFLSLRGFDEFLEREVQQRFPMAAAPKPVAVKPIVAVPLKAVPKLAVKPLPKKQSRR